MNAANLKLVEGAGQKVAKAAKLLTEGHRSIESAGRLLLDAQAIVGKGLEYKALLGREGIAERTARRAIQFANDIDAAKRHREKERARNARRVPAAVVPDRDPPSENNGVVADHLDQLDTAFYEASAALFRMSGFLRWIVDHPDVQKLAEKKYQDELVTMAGYAEEICRQIRKLTTRSKP